MEDKPTTRQQIDKQADDFESTLEDTSSDEGIVKNIDELKELIDEGKNNLVDEEGTPLTNDELKELVDPEKPAMKPEDLS